MSAAILLWSRRAVLLLMVVAGCLAGNVAPYLVALLLIGIALLMLARGELFATWREPLAAMFLAAFAGLLLAFSLTAETPADAAFAFNFVMLLLAAPLLTLMRAGANPGNTRVVAWLAFAGAVVGLAVVCVALAMGAQRGFWIALGPIRLSNTALLFGFLALLGLLAPGGRERPVLLLGPVIGIATVILTGSRGPLLALALMAPVALVFALRVAPRRLLVPMLGGLAVLAGLTIVLLVTQERFAALPQAVADALAGNAVADTTTHIRLTLYRAALEAFAQSPWIGHGWDEMMTAIVPFLDEAGRAYAADLPQLHNDVLDFAVAAGVVGIAIYLLLLAAPIVAALLSPRDSQRTARLYGAFVLVASYIGAGLTDLMFGFEFHTALYVVLAATLIGYCRDADAPRRGDNT